MDSPYKYTASWMNRPRRSAHGILAHVGCHRTRCRKWPTSFGRDAAVLLQPGQEHCYPAGFLPSIILQPRQRDQATLRRELAAKSTIHLHRRCITVRNASASPKHICTPAIRQDRSINTQRLACRCRPKHGLAQTSGAPQAPAAAAAPEPPCSSNATGAAMLGRQATTGTTDSPLLQQPETTQGSSPGS
ncbi:hypothetical protein PMI06_003226 [Burkholderia sp. BT03]|nr:hypothetical protein PMI06_003226 [Burkholderia sp. BT03]SKC60299.1 hypothetical protein SAMN06266956_1106 [Paraburkholderia hospita]